MRPRSPLLPTGLALLLASSLRCGPGTIGGTGESGGVSAGGGVGGINGGTLGGHGGSSNGSCGGSGGGLACSNGLATSCGIDGCTISSFCPGGCGPDGETCEPLDGGLGSCVASSLAAEEGLLFLGSADGGGVAIEQGTTIILATSAALACESTVDAGIEAPEGPAAIVTLYLGPKGFNGAISEGSPLVILTTWIDGGLTSTPATQGQIDMAIDQPGGGVTASYAFTFGKDFEQGTFIAPACDVCATPP